MIFILFPPGLEYAYNWLYFKQQNNTFNKLHKE